MEQNLFGNKPVLVTGASGLLGGHLLFALLSKGIRVRAFIRNEQSKARALSVLSLYTHIRYDSSLIEWCYGDICDYEDVMQAMQSVDYVFHCAGYVSFSPKDAAIMQKVNVEGTQHIVNAALQQNIVKLCHVSSIAAIGKAENKKHITEDCEYQLTKDSPAYNATKYLGELEVWRGIAEGLSAVIVNPSVIIGPGNWNTGSASLFQKIANGMDYYTTGVTGYVSVQDVVDCMVALMQSNIQGERFIVSAQNIDFLTLFSSIASSLGVAPPSKLAKPWQIKLYARLLTFVSAFTGSSPQISKQTAKTAFTKSCYSNKKIVDALSYEFRDVFNEIHTVGNMYLFSH